MRRANCSIVHGSEIKALSEYSDLRCFDECCLVHSLDQHLVTIIRHDRQNITKSAISIQILKRSDRNVDLVKRIRTKFWSLKSEGPKKSYAKSEFLTKNVAIANCRTTHVGSCENLLTEYLCAPCKKKEGSVFTLILWELYVTLGSTEFQSISIK